MFLYIFSFPSSEIFSSYCVLVENAECTPECNTPCDIDSMKINVSKSLLTHHQDKLTNRTQNENIAREQDQLLSIRNSNLSEV